jgi:hypothetical protein
VTDDEIHELARQFLPAIRGGDAARQEQALLNFGREIDFRTRKWAQRLVSDAAGVIGGGPMRSRRT